jgi:hypothetical protein
MRESPSRTEWRSSSNKEIKGGLANRRETSKARRRMADAGVCKITNEFILGLDILRAYDESVELGRQTLRLAGEGIAKEPRDGAPSFLPGSDQGSS